MCLLSLLPVQGDHRAACSTALTGGIKKSYKQAKRKESKCLLAPLRSSS